MTDRTHRLDSRLAALRSLSRALSRPLNLTDILRSAHKEMSRVLDAPVCFFGLYDAGGQSVEVVWQIHEGTELPGGHFPLGSGVTSQAIRTGQPQLIRNWSQQGPRVQVEYATDRPGLPESTICVPVMFDERVVGILSVQSYRPQAFDEDDVALVQGVAEQVAVATFSQGRFLPASTDSPWHVSELEAILASMPDAVLVLDAQGRLVRMNQAARELLCLDHGGGLILGHPADRPQDGRWPLGTRAVTEQLRPVIEQLKHGEAPHHEVQVDVSNGTARSVACRASVLLKEGSHAGGVMVLRENQS